MNPISVKFINNKWYLIWNIDSQTIAAFSSEFEAYSARRALLS